MRNFREYDIWIDAMDITDTIYDIVSVFPKEEKFGLISQITRSAVSIPSNIAEGASRSSEKDFARFLEISIGSTFELETQLRISCKREFISITDFENILEQIISLQKRISGLRKSILR